MRLLNGKFEQWRDRSARVYKHYGSFGDETCGVFGCWFNGTRLHIVASTGEGWDHVSVSTQTRCPTWDEMQWVKRTFFADDEWAIEYHPPKADNISVHPYCLHLWRPHDAELPKPPTWTIA